MTRDDLVARYHTLRHEYERVRALVDGASVVEQFITELKLLSEAHDAAELDLEGASRTSGYSTDHLRRLVRNHKLPCVRVGRRLFFRASDLPRKLASRIDVPSARRYDAVADAQRVTAQRFHGDSSGTFKTV